MKVRIIEANGVKEKVLTYEFIFNQQVLDQIGEWSVASDTSNVFKINWSGTSDGTSSVGTITTYDANGTITYTDGANTSHTINLQNFAKLYLPSS
ncbi:hypothetical protein AYK24_00420 [Thermoplasmatales archaeon SG8-52-4]|nr:MAG: hypothetical protein AYK24_00420 [Thermoplasmatales archaeon SG8-52-4]